MERNFCKMEETADKYIFMDGVTGKTAAFITKTGNKFSAAGEEAKMVQKIKRAYADYISELHHRKASY